MTYFPNFNLFIFGGVNYEPYKVISLKILIGRKVDSIELYPASEGFFAFQDQQNDKGMLLQLDSGIFYEFIKADTFFDENPNANHTKRRKTWCKLCHDNLYKCWALGHIILETQLNLPHLKPYKVNCFWTHQALYFCFWRTCHRKRSRTRY